MSVLDQLFGTWLGVLTLPTIGCVIGMGAFLFLFVRRRMPQ